MSKLINMTGWVMKEHGIPDSLITVIDRAKNNNTTVMWNCKCECGNVFVAQSQNIRNGNTKTCGCRPSGKKNLIDITGWKMWEHGISDSRVEVISREGVNNNHSATWLCKCSCGKIFTTAGENLRSGKTKSCGCYKYDNNIIDMSNWVMQEHGVPNSQLTVKKYAGNLDKNHRRTYWLCKCNCGNDVVARADNIRNGNVISCGCYTSQRCRDFFSKLNAKNLLNQKFNKLFVKELVGSKLTQAGGKVWLCICECGNTIQATTTELTHNLIQSCGCDKKLNISKGEIKIKDILDQHKITYLHNKAFFKDLVGDNNDVLRYDFILFNNDTPHRLIEFDGLQHYQAIEFFGGEEGFIKRYKYDQIKNHYALEHNIPLIRIPYYEIENINLDMLMNNTYLVRG